MNCNFHLNFEGSFYFRHKVRATYILNGVQWWKILGPMATQDTQSFKDSWVWRKKTKGLVSRSKSETFSSSCWVNIQSWLCALFNLISGIDNSKARPDTLWTCKECWDDGWLSQTLTKTSQADNSNTYKIPWHLSLSLLSPEISEVPQ